MCPEMAFFHGSRAVSSVARLSVVSANGKARTSSRVSNLRHLPWDGGFAMYKSIRSILSLMWAEHLWRLRERDSQGVSWKLQKENPSPASVWSKRLGHKITQRISR